MKNTSFVRNTGLVTVIGALVGLGLSVARAATNKSGAFQTSGNFAFVEILTVLAFSSLLIGAVGLARSGAAGFSLLGKIGFGLALPGLTMATLFELSAGLQNEPADMLGILAGLLAGLGMLLVGIAIVQAQHWQGWRRYAPLFVGLYPLAMVFAYPLMESNPALTAGGSQDLDLVLTALWFICWLPLGIALWIEASQRQASQPKFAG